MMASSKVVWYAVHVINYFRLRKRIEKSYLVFENVYVVRARSFEEARIRGEQYGREDAAVEDQTTINGVPARQIFGGVRKIVACAARAGAPQGPEVVRMQDGVEATYSRFIVNGQGRLRALLRGKRVAAIYEE